MQRAAEHKTQS